MNFILSMKVKASCVEESHFILFMIQEHVVYNNNNIVCSHCSTAVENDPVYVYIYIHIYLLIHFTFSHSSVFDAFLFYSFFYSVWSICGAVCFVLFGGNARCFIVSDQQKYIKCMLCLICIEMWFKVCLKTRISIVRRRKEEPRP